MTPIGKALPENAQKFVATHHNCKLGSMTADGFRRVVTIATGNELASLIEEFANISIGMTSATLVKIVEKQEPPKCEFRGSERHTCCGSPDVWICRELKKDCVATREDAKKLQSMVATQEAKELAICETCTSRKDSGTATRNLSLPEQSVSISGLNQLGTNTELQSIWPKRSLRKDKSFRVGFLSAAYMKIGGTETFHRSLLPRLKKNVNVAGFVATAFHGGEGKKLQVHYETGVNAAKTLAEHCDLIVMWGIDSLTKILPIERPKVIAVHHSEPSSDWSNRIVLDQLDVIDDIICVNSKTSEQLSSCGKQTHYIPNAIDPERIIPTGKQLSFRSDFKIEKKSKIVLFAHRLCTDKRPDFAISIANKLPSDWTMIIAGDGPERSMIQQLADDCEKVRFVGACDSLADWLSISDCFLSLSTFEGFGLSIGEAMAAGVPTVSTPTGIATGRATTLPTNATEQEWADAIATASVRVSPEEILERFSVDRMLSSWIDVIARHAGRLSTG